MRYVLDDGHAISYEPLAMICQAVTEYTMQYINSGSAGRWTWTTAQRSQISGASNYYSLY